MDKILELLAARNVPDGILKGGFIMLPYAACRMAAELAVYGHVPGPLYWNVAMTVGVGLPFLSILLIAISHFHGMKTRLGVIASTDGLTGLRNRRAFQEEVGALRAAGVEGLLLLADADHFKAVNDTFGHATGDKCLEEISVQLLSVLRKSDVVGRIGGEEFAAFLPGATPSDPDWIAERLCAPLLVTAVDSRKPVTLTLSVGLTATRPGEALDRALNRADSALYVAKENGRARLEVAAEDRARAADKYGLPALAG